MEPTYDADLEVPTRPQNARTAHLDYWLRMEDSAHPLRALKAVVAANREYTWLAGLFKVTEAAATKTLATNNGVYVCTAKTDDRQLTIVTHMTDDTPDVHWLSYTDERRRTVVFGIYDPNRAITMRRLLRDVTGFEG